MIPSRPIIQTGSRMVASNELNSPAGRESDNGSAAWIEGLIPEVYRELRAIAAAIMRDRGRNETLCATELVHDALLRLGKASDLHVGDPSHLVALAARAMHRVLLDRRRARIATKRGGPGRDGSGVALRRVDLSEAAALPSQAPPEALEELAQRIERLEGFAPRPAHAVILRYFGGLGAQEIAEVCNCSKRTVELDLQSAVAWLRSTFADQAEPDDTR
jgi:RNA polymerase sigma factor (TIGR02999 family)